MTVWRQHIEDAARTEARQLKHPYIRSEHVVLALLKHDASVLDISYDDFLARVQQLPVPACGAQQKLTLAQGAKRAFVEASVAHEDDSSALIAALLATSPLVRRLLTKDDDHAA